MCSTSTTARTPSSWSIFRLARAAIYGMARRVPGWCPGFQRRADPGCERLELLRGGDRALLRAPQVVSVIVAFAGYASTLFVIVVQAPLLRVLFTEDYTAAPRHWARCSSRRVWRAGGHPGPGAHRARTPLVVPPSISPRRREPGLNAVLLPRWPCFTPLTPHTPQSAIFQRAAVARAGFRRARPASWCTRCFWRPGLSR